jgi:signal transduction histidine kinase/CheY-like chemotaxis protein
VSLAVFGAALALLMIVQGPRRLSNQYFALCMVAFSLFGLLNMVWQVPQQFDLEPRPLRYATTSVYLIAIILLFNFIITFGGLPPRIRRIEHVISIPLLAAGLAMLWSDRIYGEFVPLRSGSYHFTLTPIGEIGSLLVVLYLISSLILLRSSPTPRGRALMVPVLLLVAGVVAFALVTELRDYSLNAVAIVIAVGMIGRAVIKYQVFQPLADLNLELAVKNQQLYEATQLKSQFLATMSHELRTPLNSIIGYSDLVLSRTYGDLSDLQVDRLTKVMRNGHLLLDLINDVLDLSKIEAGRLELSLTRLPTRSLLDSLADSFEPQAAARDLRFVRAYGDLPEIWGDDVRVRQIINNLLSNALKYTDEGSVTLGATVNRVARHVVIRVADTGIGIEPERHATIFEAFHNGDSSASQPRYQGTRLGLALARRLTELHQGRVWFESAPGHGSTFYVTLPLAPSFMPSGAVLEPPAHALGPIIVSIDDDCEALEVLQGQLGAAHFRVYGACTASDGLQLVRDLKPALITLDLRMPGMDGWQLFELLRREPGTASTPVLIITATDERAPARLSPIDGFMTKPIQPDELLQQVRRLLKTGERYSEVQS